MACFPLFRFSLSLCMFLSPTPSSLSLSLSLSLFQSLAENGPLFSHSWFGRKWPFSPCSYRTLEPLCLCHLALALPRFPSEISEQQNESEKNFMHPLHCHFVSAFPLFFFCLEAKGLMGFLPISACVCV